MISKVIVFICLLSSITYSQSCRCMLPDTTTAEGLIHGADQIFIGKVQKIIRGEDINASIKIKFKIIKWYMSSSQLSCGHTIYITTCGNSACCGYNFEKNKTYLIYAYQGSTSTCSSTKPLSEASNDITLLNKYFNKK